jgi:TPR repeat protein
MSTFALLLSTPQGHPLLSALGRLLLALALCCSMQAEASPAEDHTRALTAYQRGDVVAAIRALRPAAAAGHAPSQALLGFILEKSGEVTEALDLYARAAAQDEIDGHVGLAQLLLAGVPGVAKDEKRALQHFSKAAARGHAGSIMLLAEAYRLGRHGLAPDAPEAALWQQRAAALKGKP